MEETRNLIIGSIKNVVGIILKELFNIRIWGGIRVFLAYITSYLTEITSKKG